MSVLQKVGKEEVQGSGSAQARLQGMEEQVAVKQPELDPLRLNERILCSVLKRGPGWQWLPAPPT